MLAAFSSHDLFNDIVMCRPLKSATAGKFFTKNKKAVSNVEITVMK